MEVDEQHRAAAPHHAVRRHRRIDAARQQARHACRRCRSADRRRPAPCRRSRTRASGSISTWIVSSGVVEIDVPARRLLDEPADLALDLRRRERKALVGAARADAERRRLAVAEVARGSRPRVRRKSSGARPAQREVRDAEHASRRGRVTASQSSVAVRARSRCGPSPSGRWRRRVRAAPRAGCARASG